jgi:hypothetical protein
MNHPLPDMDLSDLELRTLAWAAHIRPRGKAIDIHTARAALVFGVPGTQVTEAQRRYAKALNYAEWYTPTYPLGTTSTGREQGTAHLRILKDRRAT